MANKKRPKYVQEVIDQVNLALKIREEKNPHCSLMLFIIDYLIAKDMYKGYNFYNEIERNGVKYNVLAGSATDFEFIQVY